MMLAFDSPGSVSKIFMIALMRAKAKEYFYRGSLRWFRTKLIGAPSKVT